LTLLSHYLEQLARESSTPYLFAQPPRLPFRSTRSECPDCHASLKVLKTRTKTVYTLPLGGFTAQETLLHCDQCPNEKIYPAEALSGLVPAGSTFGYDVIVFVGQALFLRHRCAEEIVAELRARNVRLSLREVAYLGKKFVVYLALAHRQSAPRLKQVMRQKGGYILHLDGTGEGGGPILMSSLDSLSQIVLGNVKIPSEKAAEIIPFLKEIKARYGDPLANVHDMGPGILAAIKEVFPHVPDFICHFHFLRDLGKDLLEPDYDTLRLRLRHHAITEKLQSLARRLKPALEQDRDLLENYFRSVRSGALPVAQLDRFPLVCAYSLIQWILEGKSQGEGYGFPFDRPQLAFAQRLLAAAKELELIKHIHLRGQWEDNIPLFKLACELEKVATDGGLKKTIEAITVKIQVFDELRAAMRLAEVGGSSGLNSGSEPVAMGPIQKAVAKFRHRVTSRSDYPAARHWKAMIDQIDKYGDKLFADPILVPTPNGPLRVQPQRTNNLMERFFRDFRRTARRRSGHNSLSKFLQSMIADTPLVKNLENPEYLKVLLNGQPSLEACFAQFDIEEVRQELVNAQQGPDRVPSQIRRLIAAPTFLATLCGFFHKPLAKST
jgi:hypothetical protein